MLVAGERRWRAAQQAGLKKVPALVRTLSAQHKLELALIENVQREDLNPLETAQAYMKLRDEFNLSLADISQRVGGKSVTVISNYIRLLGLPEQAKKAITEKKITEGHARQILALEGNTRAQSILLQHIIKDGWSVRQAERFVIGYKKGSGKREQHTAATRATLSETPLTKKLSKKLQTRVNIKTTARGGQLLISFKDDSDLRDILTRF
jgi:ParB family chromosome partitioning protein